MSSFDVIENDDYEIILIEMHPCNSKEELERRERFYIESNDCVNRTFKRERLTDGINHNLDCVNREKQLEYFKKYRNENKDKINEKNNEHFICDCGGKYAYCHKTRHTKSKKHMDWEASNNSPIKSYLGEF